MLVIDPTTGTVHGPDSLPKETEIERTFGKVPGSGVPEIENQKAAYAEPLPPARLNQPTVKGGAR